MRAEHHVLDGAGGFACVMQIALGFRGKPLRYDYDQGCGCRTI